MVIAVLFPGQRYQQRRKNEQIQERRRRFALAEQELLPAAGDQAVQAEEPARMPELVPLHRRLADIESIARDQDELLRAKAGELERTRAVEISTAAGQISARITRFRWGADVIEVTRTSGGEQCGWSLGRLPRSPRPARAAIVTRQLAQALAALQPVPPPAAPER